MQGGLAAIKFLTIGGHFDAAPIDPQQLGKDAPYFPFVGLVLGLLLALLNRVLESYLESEILGVVIVMLWILVTGAFHLRGTQQTFDGFAAGTRSESEVPKPIGLYGFLALLLIVLLKVRSVEVIGETRNLSLLLTPIFARWSLVIFLYGAASSTGETAGIIAKNVRAWHLLVTTVATLLFAAYLVGRIALWIALWLSLLSLLSRNYLQQRHGGITCDHLGALIELSETLSLFLFASL